MEWTDDIGADLTDFQALVDIQVTLKAKLAAVAEIIESIEPGCDWVSIALVVQGEARTGAVSSDVAIAVDLVQYDHDEGPCLTAARLGSIVRIDVLGHDERYEHFAPGAIELGVESVMSVPLISGDAVVGSLNLYSSTAHGFDDSTAERLRPLAEYATRLITYSPVYVQSLVLVDRVSSMVVDTDLVQQSIGVLIAKLGVTSAAAWTELRRRADEAGLGLPDAARAVLASVPQDSER